MEAFQWITMEISDTHSYLGMLLKLKDGYAVVDMKNFVEKIWEWSDFMSPLLRARPA